MKLPYLVFFFMLSCAGLSRSTFSEAECRSCQRPSILLGETLLVTVFTPRSNSDSPQAPPININCGDVACKVEAFSPHFDSGPRDRGSSKQSRVRNQYAIRPTEVGELNLSVQISADFGTKKKIIHLGKLRVIQSQAIVVQCLARSKKGTIQDCGKDALISIEDEVQLRISAMGNDGLRMPGVEHEVKINGVEFPWAKPGAWRCKMSVVNEDGRGAIQTCYGRGLKAGQYDINIRLGKLTQKIGLSAK